MLGCTGLSYLGASGLNLNLLDFFVWFFFVVVVSFFLCFFNLLLLFSSCLEREFRILFFCLNVCETYKYAFIFFSQGMLN